MLQTLHGEIPHTRWIYFPLAKSSRPFYLKGNFTKFTKMLNNLVFEMYFQSSLKWYIGEKFPSSHFFTVVVRRRKGLWWPEHQYNHFTDSHQWTYSLQLFICSVIMAKSVVNLKEFSLITILSTVHGPAMTCNHKKCMSQAADPYLFHVKTAREIAFGVTRNI